MDAARPAVKEVRAVTPRATVAPKAVRIGIAVTATVAGLLSSVVERGDLHGIDGPDRRSPVSLFLILLLVATWLLESQGMSWPLPAFIALVAVPEAWLVYVGRSSSSPISLVLLVGWVAYTATRRDAVIALVAAILAILLPLPWAAGEYLDWLGWGFGISFSWLAMLALATQRQILAELRAAQADLAQQSAAAERQRIARDIHDVVAHSLAITMLRLTGARHILARDPARAAEALAQAEHLGRQSLADIRRTVGLLSTTDDRNGRSRDVAPAPLPGVGDLADLVAGYAGAGLDVTLAVDGDSTSIPPAVGLDLYRIAQEALANVVKHAPAAQANVHLMIGPHDARLRVRNTASRLDASPLASVTGSGLGLIGMRQRATLLDGTLSSGPSAGGWLVDCAVPLDTVALPSATRKPHPGGSP